MNTTYIAAFFKFLAAMVLFCVLVLVPYSVWWLADSGDVALDAATTKQASGEFALAGFGIAQDFVEYKLALYRKVHPEIAVVGSSRVMEFRGKYFSKKFLNIGGTAGNLSILRSTLEAMIRENKPQVVLLGLDFWWFTKKWEAKPDAIVPPSSGSYTWTFEALKKPYEWLLTGKISPRLFFAPVLGEFRADRYGVMAQRGNDGFGSDGSWYYTSQITGTEKTFDYKFADTLKEVRHNIKAFAQARALSEEHLDVFAQIYCSLRARGIQVYVFIPPLSPIVLDEMRAHEAAYPQLFTLRAALQERGIEVMDFTDARSVGSNDCEFVDGFHGGQVTYARMLREMTDRHHALVNYVDVQKLDSDIMAYKGHAFVPDPNITSLPEIDFMHFNCPKK